MNTGNKIKTEWPLTRKLTGSKNSFKSIKLENVSSFKSINEENLKKLFAILFRAHTSTAERYTPLYIDIYLRLL